MLTTTLIGGLMTNPLNVDLMKEVKGLEKIEKTSYTQSINDIYRSDKIIKKFA